MNVRDVSVRVYITNDQSRIHLRRNPILLEILPRAKVKT
jgi:hypothetical protein